MKFIVDAQLPRRLASQLNLFGHDAVHCLDLPLGNRTPDEAIITLAIQKSEWLLPRIVILLQAIGCGGFRLNFYSFRREIFPTIFWLI